MSRAAVLNFTSLLPRTRRCTFTSSLPACSGPIPPIPMFIRSCIFRLWKRCSEEAAGRAAGRGPGGLAVPGLWYRQAAGLAHRPLTLEHDGGTAGTAYWLRADPASEDWPRPVGARRQRHLFYFPGGSPCLHGGPQPALRGRGALFYPLAGPVVPASENAPQLIHPSPARRGGKISTLRFRRAATLPHGTSFSTKSRWLCTRIP